MSEEASGAKAIPLDDLGRGRRVIAGSTPSEPVAAAPTRDALADVVPALSMDMLYSGSVAANHLGGEAADRVAIRELIDGWAHCADRRLPDRQAPITIAVRPRLLQGN